MNRAGHSTPTPTSLSRESACVCWLLHQKGIGGLLCVLRGDFNKDGKALGSEWTRPTAKCPRALLNHHFQSVIIINRPSSTIPCAYWTNKLELRQIRVGSDLGVPIRRRRRMEMEKFLVRFSRLPKSIAIYIVGAISWFLFRASSASGLVSFVCRLRRK